MKRTTLLTAGLLSALLPTASFANCGNKAVICNVIDSNSHNLVIGMFKLRYKMTSGKIHDAGSLFTATINGFKCEPCVDDRCDKNGRSFNAILEKCQQKAKALGYTEKEGFLTVPTGVSLSSALKSILMEVERIARTATEIRNAKNSGQSIDGIQ